MSKKKAPRKAAAPLQVNILVLEHNSNEPRLLERQSKKNRFRGRIFTAFDRETFLAAIEQVKFDLILADYSLPGFNGMAALKIAMETCPEVPFIFVSGKTTEEQIEETLRQGAAEYLQKGQAGKLILSATRALREKTIRNGDYKLERNWDHFLVAPDDLLALLDLEGNLKLLNPSWERRFGFSPTELLDHTLKSFIHNRDHAKFATAMQSVLEHGHWTGELGQRTKTAETSMQTRWMLLRDANGAPKCIWYTASDVTEKKQLEAEFLRVQRLENVGALASGIAHDLNNVLAPILMAAGLIDPAGSANKNAHLLEIVKLNAQRGAELVKQILSFTCDQDATRTVIAVDAVLFEVTRMLRHTFPKSIDIQAVLPKGLPPIQGDLTQLHQILMNLCLNARDAMADGGTLQIEAGTAELKTPCPAVPEEIPPGRYTIVKISDTGCGIEEEHLGKIFEPFFTTKPVEQRNGLGLFTVLKLVTEHSGFIRVISELDRGTRFELYFPALQEQSAKAQSAVPVTELPRGKGETVLVVDDERAMLEIIEAILKRFGYNVLVAANGVEALSLFAKHKHEIGLVIIDIMMPLLDGAATIAAIQKISPHINLIGISGLATNERLCGLFPRTQFLQKPFSLDRLLAAVKQALVEVPAMSATAAAA